MPAVYDVTTGETFIFFGGPGRTAQDPRLDVTAVSSTDLVSPPSSRLLVPDLLPPLPRCSVGVFSHRPAGCELVCAQEPEQQLHAAGHRPQVQRRPVRRHTGRRRARTTRDLNSSSAWLCRPEARTHTSSSSDLTTNVRAVAVRYAGLDRPACHPDVRRRPLRRHHLLQRRPWKIGKLQASAESCPCRPWSLPEVRSQPSRVPQWHYSTKLLGGVLATEGEITELFPPKSDGASGEGTAGAEPTLYYTIRNDKPHLPRQFATSTDLGS